MYYVIVVRGHDIEPELVAVQLDFVANSVVVDLCMQNVNCFSPHWRTCKLTAVLWFCVSLRHFMDLL